MFYIKVKDKNIPDSPEYILDAFIDTDGGYINVYIGDTCVRFIIEDGDPEAVLEDFNTRKSCDINNSLIEGSGTRYMLMGALQFLMKKYTFIKYVNLSDVAQKKGTRIYLTPKRLLLGQSGWYEAHFGAKPTSKTRKIHHEILNKISLTPENRHQIAKQSWGTPEDIEALHPIAKKLIHNDWVISRKTIKAYPVEIDVLTKLTGGSHSHIKRTNVRYINDLFKAVQIKHTHT